MRKKSSGDKRTIIIFDEQNNVELIPGEEFVERYAAGGMEGALQVGPRLVTNGRITVNPKEEGFRDPKILTKAGARSAIGLTRDHKLLMLTTGGATIPELAQVMKQAGAYQAMNMDGGASSGLYYDGKYLTVPVRKISNALMIVSQ
jgi:exopolysaccharide biosynthesis protein